MDKTSRIFLAGHKGMVGSALMRALRADGFNDILTAAKGDLDLRDSRSVDSFFERERPRYVLLAAAKVGGIEANRQSPADFIYDNLMIQTNVIHQSHRHEVEKLLFMGTSCIYPRECPQPMREEYLLTGTLEPTNEAYAVAKIAGLKMARYYYEQHGLRSVCPMPCNLYGPGDSFDPTNSHVLSALVKRFVDAADEGKPEVICWGSGIARREFLHVDDLARASLFLMQTRDSPDIINVGSGEDIAIKTLAEMIADKVGYRGKIVWDTNMPDGMPRKCLDVSKMQALGFRPSVTLEDGIDGVISEYSSIKARSDRHGSH